MTFLIGLLIVLGSIGFGYAMHSRDFLVLFQPSEILIILGSSLGAYIIASKYEVSLRTLKSLKYLISSPSPKKEDYVSLCVLCFNLFKVAKSKGLLALEEHVESPEDSAFFKNASKYIKDNENVKKFLLDNLRIILTGINKADDLESMMNHEIEVYTDHELETSGSLFFIADALPALGIVGAVLGMIVTMRSVMEPPDVLGALVASALSGTFLGVLIAYTMVAPIAKKLETYSIDHSHFLQSIKLGLIGYVNGHQPAVVVELMRKATPQSAKPSFQEVEKAINAIK
ncbi:Motility protein A [Rickettsiales endosymbiont of Paramecium tredecaurelia]|uniref:motility-associated protein n=1 Tax=Candidatus Sarmatiella mevalonica TaxID=2770581 RepID=UPI0019211BCD|nr:motility-associated protein [Candidatus Sarmatiella mevalonica]MBL3284319.1 Motility protein A [Candidatus Sarmatiella mevalonica]